MLSVRLIHSVFCYFFNYRSLKFGHAFVSESEFQLVFDCGFTSEPIKLNDSEQLNNNILDFLAPYSSFFGMGKKAKVAIISPNYIIIRRNVANDLHCHSIFVWSPMWKSE